jgi:hypothetical protein
MRFAISLVALFISIDLRADPIHIYYETDSNFAHEIKDIFTREYSLPEEIITLKKINFCKEIREKSKLDICLNENGDLQVVSVDQRFISESLKVFKAPKGHL